MLKAKEGDSFSVLLLLDLCPEISVLALGVFLSGFQPLLILSITKFFFPVSKLLWHLLNLTPVVSVMSCVSVHCCQQFCFSSYPLMFGVPLLLVLDTALHSDIARPSAFCRQHPTSKINYTKWCTKPCMWLAVNVQMTKSWMCNNQLKLNEDETKAILFSTPCHCLPSSVIISTHGIAFLDKGLGVHPWP